MSDHPHYKYEPSPVTVALQQGLAKFVTRYMEGKYALLNNVVNKIEAETKNNEADSDKLKNLRAEMNDVFMNENDIDQADKKATKIIAIVERLSEVYLKINKIFYPHRYHDHSDHH